MSDPSQTIEEYEKEIFDLRQLLEISKSLSSNLDYSSLLDSILYICMGQMRVTQAGLFSRDNLEIAGFRLMRNQEGFDLNPEKRYVIQSRSPLTTHLFHHYKCFTLAELEEEIDDERSLQVLRSLQPSLLVPLKVKDKLTGILILGERIGGLDYTDEEKEYLLDIAHFASIAIHNAILFEMSTTDLMTHLKLRHYFFTILTERVYKLKSSNNRKKEHISLIMGDIDHFKNINDTYGHQVGDEVIKTISMIIRENLRQQDVGSRYGGEEFIILLHETTEAEAFEIAERLRKRIGTCEEEKMGCEEQITMSFGVAEYNEELDSSGDALIKRVDKALYYSKRSGRNRTTEASSIDIPNH